MAKSKGNTERLKTRRKSCTYKTVMTASIRNIILYLSDNKKTFQEDEPV